MTRRALIAEVFLRLIYPLLLLASLWVLLRGHNAPGGGFIGGLLAVAASSAYALTFDAARALRKLPLEPQRLAAVGVLIALFSGVPALFNDLPFLTHPWRVLPLGIVDLPLSTVMLFDVGVYFSVWGALGGYCLALIRSIEEPT